MIYFALLSCAASIIAIIAIFWRKSKSNPLAFVGSIIGIVSGFIALAISAPRDFEQHSFDYLGIIVAILAVFATLLLAMQLYHVFRLKEDAKEVHKAKKRIDKYADRIDKLKRLADGLSETIDELSTKTEALEEDIKPLYDSIADIEERFKTVVTFNPYDGPCDDK